MQYTNNINDKISLIIDTNQLFDLNDQDVYDILCGDSYKISETYKKMLKIFKENLNHNFTHKMSNETKSLKDWIDFYRCDINDPKSMVIFLSLSIPLLKF